MVRLRSRRRRWRSGGGEQQQQPPLFCGALLRRTSRAPACHLAGRSGRWLFRHACGPRHHPPAHQLRAAWRQTSPAARSALLPLAAPVVQWTAASSSCKAGRTASDARQPHDGAPGAVASSAGPLGCAGAPSGTLLQWSHGGRLALSAGGPAAAWRQFAGGLVCCASRFARPGLRAARPAGGSAQRRARGRAQCHA